MQILPIIFLTLALFSQGCTTVISEKSRALVNSDASFESLKTSPETYIGKHMIMGGRVAAVRNSGDGGEIEVVQFDLGSSGYPNIGFLSYGRFLAVSNEFIDPLIVSQGGAITLVGEVKGKKTRRLDTMDYTYPVIELREWHIWPQSPDSSSSYPSPAPQYNPSSYGYGTEPFLQRPYNFPPVAR